jgi:hypothetical protein
MARAPAMAILLSKRGMSMGNTCQLPMVVPKGLVLQSVKVAFPTDIWGHSVCFLVVRFALILHKHSLLCTGSAQAIVAFELRSKAATVHSLSRQS